MTMPRRAATGTAVALLVPALAGCAGDGGSSGSSGPGRPTPAGTSSSQAHGTDSPTVDPSDLETTDAGIDSDTGAEPEVTGADGVVTETETATADPIPTPTPRKTVTVTVTKKAAAKPQQNPATGSRKRSAADREALALCAGRTSDGERVLSGKALDAVNVMPLTWDGDSVNAAYCAMTAKDAAKQQGIAPADQDPVRASADPGHAVVFVAVDTRDRPAAIKSVNPRRVAVYAGLEGLNLGSAPGSTPQPNVVGNLPSGLGFSQAVGLFATHRECTSSVSPAVDFGTGQLFGLRPLTGKDSVNVTASAISFGPSC